MLSDGMSYSRFRPEDHTKTMTTVFYCYYIQKIYYFSMNVQAQHALCYYSAAVLSLLCIVSFSDLAYYYHYYGQL